jgi:chromosome segregation ATPase
VRGIVARMYGDTQAIRHRARELRRIGDEIRSEARDVQRAADTVHWSGLAADAVRAVARQRAAALRRAADLHDEAAAALDDHAEAVDRVKRLIAAIERRVLALVAAARDRLAGVLGVVGAVIDPVDEWLDRFVPPPSGHLDWLRVDVPGLDVGSMAAAVAA